jgi:hypothetical protein
VQTPWWITLVAAGTTAVITGIVSAFLTQWLIGRRERQHRLWQQAQDEARWHRERAERQEQWQREDRARWHSDRRAVYGQVVTAVEEWGRYASPWDLRPEHLEQHTTPVLEAIGAATIVAGPGAVDQLRRIGGSVLVISANAIAAAEMPETPDGISLESVVSEGAQLVRSRLADVVRADIDIESAPSERTRAFEKSLGRVRDLWMKSEGSQTGPQWATMTTLLLDQLVGDKEFFA